MMWLSRIFFSAAGIASLFGSTVTGTVELKDSRATAVRKHRDFSGVVIAIEPVDGSAVPGPTPNRARMVQKDKTFTPHVLPIQVGTTVDFPNYDPIFHNAFSNYDGQLFDVGLYPPGTSRPVHFTREGVVRIFCNIHSTMSAVIVVLKTPYFATTDRGGSFQIAGVPPGEYRLKVFHERATELTLDKLQQRITMGNDALQITPISISESGYLPIPHKNKFGRDYSPVPDDRVIYPATRE
jgi:plastocyanin